MPRIVPGQAAELSLTMARAGFQDVVGYPDQANENSVPPLTVETSDLPVRGFAKNGRNKAAKFGMGLGVSSAPDRFEEMYKFMGPGHRGPGCYQNAYMNTIEVRDGRRLSPNFAARGDSAPPHCNTVRRYPEVRVGSRAVTFGSAVLRFRPFAPDPKSEARKALLGAPERFLQSW